MVFIPFPDGALAILEYGDANNLWTNTLWFHDLEGGGEDYQGLANWLMDWSEDYIMPSLYTQWDIRGVTVYDTTNQSSPVYQATGTPAAGGKSGTPAPLIPALVVTFYTASRGRSSRGRNFVTGFIEDDVTAKIVNNATVVQDIEDAYTYLMNNVQQNTGFYWVVASRYSEKQPRSAVLPIQITNVTVRSATFGSQRRRVDRG